MGGAAALGLLAPAAGAQKAEDAAASDTDTANFALTLEELEAAFHREAIARGAITGEALQFAQVAGAHETELDKPLTRQNVLDKLARTGFIVAT